MLDVRWYEASKYHLKVIRLDIFRFCVLFEIRRNLTSINIDRK